MIKKKIIYVLTALLMLAWFSASAQEFLPDTDGKYSISYSGETLGEYVITVIKGLYETEDAALDALFAAQDSDIVFYDSKKASADGNVSFDTVIPITYTDSSVFISGTGIEKPIYLGELLSDGNTDIAEAVFVGIESRYKVNGKNGSEITEKVTAYAVDSFGYPTLSNPSLLLELENGDEHVSLSSDGTLCISPMSEEKVYTIKASLENGFSDEFSFSVTREPPTTYEIFLFREDAQDRPLEKASVVGTDGVYPAFKVHAESFDQYGDTLSDSYSIFVNDTEYNYKEGFIPEADGEYTVYVVSNHAPEVKASCILTVTNRPAYKGNAALLYEALLSAQTEADRIGYDVFISEENGRDVFPDKLWTTNNAYSALTAASEKADNLLLSYESGTVSEEKYLSEYDLLIAAIEAYTSTVKSGIRKDATEISIDVSPSPEAKIPITNGVINLQPGNVRKNYVVLTSSMSPSDHTEKVTWSTSDPDVISISDNGEFSVKITGLSVGKATVTATTRTGISSTCEFNVFRPFTSILMTKNINMLLGSAPLQLTYTTLPENSGDTLSWTSSDETVATVDENGLVTAKATGKAVITATGLLGKTGTSTLTVGLPADSITLGENITDTVNMQTLTGLNLDAFASRLDGQKPLDSSVSYKIIDMVPQSDSFSKREVIYVSESGRVTAKFGGTAIVRITAASALDKVYRDVCINVFSPSQNLTLSTTRKTMPVGDTLQLNFDIRPDDTTDNVTWYSTRESVATVDKNGLVTAHSEGTARICAVSDSGITKYCTISTGYGPDLIKVTSKVSSVAAGEIAFIRAKAVRENGALCIDSSVSYEITSGSKHISVSQYGVITGLSAGTAEILIYSNLDPSVSRKISILVCEKITELSFSKESQKMYKGQILDFASMIKALPETHTEIISWESSNPDVISVDENGFVTALSVGKARIYAYGGNLSAFINVDVIEGAVSVEIATPKTTVLGFGESMLLSAKASDENGTILTSGVTWESSDKNILTVSSDGTAKALSKSGVVTVTARAVAGDVYDSITLTVIPSLYEVQLDESSIVLEAGQSLDVTTILSLLDADGNDVDKENCTFALRSRNEGVASVDGTSITAHSSGTTSVRIIVYCGRVSRNVNLTVSVTEAAEEAVEEQQGGLMSEGQTDLITETDSSPISTPTPVGAVESV